MGAKIMKHVSIQELDTAISELYDYMAAIETDVPMADKVEWSRLVRDDVVEGTQQIFKCKGHFTLVEHSYYPIRNEPCVVLVNPQCDECHRASDTLASVREVDWLGTATLKGNTMTMTIEKRV